MSSWRSFKNPLLRGSECRPLLGGLKIHPSSRVYGLLIDLILTALCQMMLVKRNLRIIWTEQKEENLFLFCLFG